MGKPYSTNLTRTGAKSLAVPLHELQPDLANIMQSAPTAIADEVYDSRIYAALTARAPDGLRKVADSNTAAVCATRVRKEHPDANGAQYVHAQHS